MRRDNAQTDQLSSELRCKCRSVLACLLVPAALLLSGCGQPFWLPPAHKIEVQQGNLISETQKNALTNGLTRDEVSAITGHPIIGNTFNNSTRWDFIYTRGPAGSAIKARRLTVLFEDDVVSAVEDNFAEETGEKPRRKTFWSRLFKSRE